MIIDGTNISTYGMKLLKVEGLHDLPRRKKTTEFATYEAAAMVTEAKKIKVSIVGRGYADADALRLAVNGLKTLIQASTVHAIELVGHGETFNGTFVDGLEVSASVSHKRAELKAEITVVQ